MPPKQPNRLLAELIEEAGISRKALARRVVDRGRALGFSLSYDHNSVRRWLDGDQPQDPVPGLIAAVLGEDLGRQVQPHQCGLGGAGAVDLGLEFGLSWSDGIETASALWRTDADQRRTVNGSYAIAAYSSAAMRWLTSTGPDGPASTGARHVGGTEVAAIRDMTSTFSDLDNRLGAGRVRTAVVQFLHTEVSSLLGGSYTETVGRDLFGAVAELTKLAGWMAYDEERHGLAQRYLIQALRLAKTANDQALSAEILAAMSHQATYVGRPSEAVDLARAAQMAARQAGLATLESECHVVEAHGHAARDDAADCAKALLAAESAFAVDDDPPPWLGYFDEAYLAAKIAHCFRELRDDDRTRRYASESLQMNDGYERGRAFNLCVLATSHVRSDPQEAVRVGEQAAAIVGTLASRRTHSYLRDLAQRLTPFDRMPDVGAFRRRVRVLTKRA
jgi:hypothetical protein